MISPPSISAIRSTRRFVDSRSCRVIEQGFLVGLQELLQPDDGLDIEVVGRLVHQENVGPAEEHAGQGDTHLPAAG